MGWLDQELVIENSAGEAEGDAIFLMSHFVNQLKKEKIPLGHLKFWVNDRQKISFSLSEELIEWPQPAKGSSCNLLINARAQIEPERLRQMVEESIHATREVGSTIKNISVSAFQPGYPRPTHRMV